MREARWNWFPWFSGMVLASWVASSIAAAEQLPPVDVVLRQLVLRAQSQSIPVPAKDSRCTKQTVTEEMDQAGNVVERKVKVGQGRPQGSAASDANKWSSQNGISLDEELLQRFQFTVRQRELIHGRPTLQITFVPKDPPAPIRHIQDHLLNRTMGTIWIDEQEHELVKASLCLGQPVSFGILGAVEHFNFSFERARSQEGYWLTYWTDTVIKARKFLQPIQTRKRVEYTDFKKLTPGAG